MNPELPLSWREGLPAELLQHPLLAGDQLSLADLLTRLLAESDRARPPVPDGPDGYEFDLATRPSWYSDGLLAAMRGSMHAAGLSLAQAQAIHSGFLQALEQEQAQRDSQQDSDRSQALDALEARHGEDLPALVAQAERAITALALPDGSLDTIYALGDAGQVVEALASIGAHLAEDRLGGGPAIALAPVDAQAELDRLTLNRDHVLAFLNPGHPGHQQAKALRARLIRQSREAVGIGQNRESLAAAGQVA